MPSWTLTARRSLAALAAAALAVLSLVVLDAAPAEAVRPPGIPSTATAQSELNALTVAAESHGSTYDRDLFPHWKSVSGTGSCTARQHVLKRDGQNVVTSDGCQPTSGNWQSDFDNTWTTSVSNATIDHVVALSEAWASGAWSWTTAQRQAFANDINSPQLWIATTSANSSKSDYDPAEWMPVNTTGLRCDYVKAWTHVKYLYNLSVDSAEKTAIQSHLNTYCGSSGGTPTNCNGAKTTAAAIPEGSPLNSTIALSCTGTASATSSVTVSITHPYSGDITIALIAPDGTSRTLKAAGGSGANINTTYSVNLSTENRSGTWTLRVTDTYSGGSSGTLNSWSLSI
ncbi:proprotein convertase P-domain-containing protein [Glycomyces sp. NPDC049804]|uniref:proprotein convertase P-domain-containing protein n=1 Tax=Glycomyces sp. NPDC049804 TaxID=3154363 RepID=UPI00341961D0